MEWYILLALIALIVLGVLLGVIVACMLGGQYCSVSIQQRQQNHELTQIQQENERKQQNKISSKFKRTFHTSSKPEPPPLAPVEDVKTLEFTLKLGDKKTNESSAPLNESKKFLIPQIRVTKAEIDEREKKKTQLEKKRDAIRKKYNL